MPAVAPCPDVNDLEHFTLGQISEEDAERVEQHLSGCGCCVAALQTVHAEDTLTEAVRANGHETKPVADERVRQLVHEVKGLYPTLAAASEKEAVVRDIRSLLTPPHQDELGRLGPYPVFEVLGVGGTGVVFRAEDPQLGRPIALKCLRPDLAGSSAARQRFLREARGAAAVVHDHVVPVYSVGEVQGLPFLAMPLLEGETLDSRLKREGKLPVADAVRIGREIAEGLAAAHAVGLVHRDVKPANVWLETLPEGSSSRARLLDFGLARPVSNDSRLTGTGLVVGTPRYMAPEQAEGLEVDGRADLFSLGSVLYTLCTGELPFAGCTCLAVLRSVCEDTPRPVREVNPEVPAWLAGLIERLHVKAPAGRFQSATEVAEALRQGADRAAAARAAATHSLRPWLAVAAAILLLPLAGLLFAGSFGDGDRDPAAIGDGPRAPAAPAVIAGLAAPAIQEQAPAQAPAVEDKGPAVYPAALFPFEERGAGVKDLGAKVSDLLFAKLAVRQDMFLVDRADLKKALAELELGLSGAVKAGEAARVGQLTGAKLLISGSVLQIDKRTYLIAKVVGTETSRTVAVSVDGKSSDELAPLVEKLAKELGDTVANKADQLVAKSASKADRLAAFTQKLKKGPRPTVMINVPERMIGAPRIDPAAQTELGRYCQAAGFTMIDPEEGLKGKADVLITGEGISEVAARNGNLVSVKARVEIKAVDRKSGKILAVDRQTAVVVGLADQIAGKAALEEAAAAIAERLLPRLITTPQE